MKIFKRLFLHRYGGKSTTTTTTTTTTTIIIIIIIVLALGGGLSLFFSRTLDRFVFEQTVGPQIDHVRVHAEIHLLPERRMEQWQDPNAIRHFKDFFHDMGSSRDVAQIKLFNRDGVLVYSTVVAEIGKRIEEEDVRRALAGEVVYKVASPKEAAALGLKHLLEIYVPILSDGNILGVTEIYFNQSRMLAIAGQLRLSVWGLILGSIVLIAVILFQTFRRQNALIARQGEELAVIVEKSPIGIYTINKDGKIDSFNPKMVELADAKSAEQVIGLNALELPTYKAVGLDKFFREGLAGKPFTTETRYISYTGKKESYRYYFGVPLLGPDGKTVERLLLLVEDISERKRLEAVVKEYSKGLEKKVAERTRELAASEEKYRSIAENALVGVFSSSVDGDILYANEALVRMLAYESREAFMKMRAPLLYKNPRDREAMISQLKKTGKVDQFEMEALGKTGEARHVLLSASLVGGVITGVVMDVTQRKKAEARIKELNELRVKFIQIISHQLRTPLNAIRWNLETLLGEQLGKLKKEQKEFIRITHEANIDIIRKISDILTVMDIEEGRTAFRRERISPESLWGSVNSEWKRKCELKELECVYNRPTSALPPLELDQEKIREVLVHLADNAVDYTPKGGKIEAALSAAKNAVRFEIKDTGVGIPAVEQPKIFTRFFRATNAAAAKPDASGLGLAIAKYFVEQHGGKIGFTSVEGKGSTFWFEIPIG